MALTNFARLTDEELTAWSRDFWKTARNMSFLHKFMGNTSNSLIQRVSELKKSQKGARAVITLQADMVGDGTMGDSTLEGNEESLQTFEQVIQLDQIRMAARHEGVMADQRAVVGFREHARSALAYALADRCDQMGFLTMSGISYKYTNNGGLRPQPVRLGSKLVDLAFADDVVAPTTGRHLRWDNTRKELKPGSTTSVLDTDQISYRTIVLLKSYAETNYIRPVMMKGGQPVYHMFLTPDQMATLKLDTDYLTNVRNAGVRGSGNELFAGTNTVMVDGIYIHTDRRVFNTSQATTGTSSNAGSEGYKWGANADVVGARALFCGAQALAFADINSGSMIEKEFDYNNQPGISYGKIVGLLKPQFKAAPSYTSKEDFGLICVDTGIS